MTSPDLTAEQRDTLGKTVALALSHDNNTKYYDVPHPSTVAARRYADQLAPVVARMLADADRQGAQRVTAAVEKALERRLHNHVDVLHIEHALAQAATPTDQP